MINFRELIFIVVKSSRFERLEEGINAFVIYFNREILPKKEGVRTLLGDLIELFPMSSLKSDIIFKYGMNLFILTCLLVFAEELLF